MCPKNNNSWRLLLRSSFPIFIFAFVFGVVALILSFFCSRSKDIELIKAKVIKYREQIIESFLQFSLLGAGDNDEVLNRLLQPDKQSRDGSFSVTETSFEIINEEIEKTRIARRFGAVEIVVTVTKIKRDYEKTRTIEMHFQSSSSESHMVALLSQVQSARVLIKSIISFLQISVNVSQIHRAKFIVIILNSLSFQLEY